jgi:hypothetical protein
MSSSEVAEVRKYGSVLRGDWRVRCVRHTMPTRERESLAQRQGAVRPSNKPKTSSPALTNTYDRATMGTLPAQRSG